MKKIAGFSRSDLLAIIVACVILSLALLPTLAANNGGLGRARELSNRTYCAANLRGLAQSMCVYAADNNDMFPLLTATSTTTYDITAKPDEGKATADDTITALYTDKKFPNNPMASLWVLVLKNQVTPKQFICKSDPFVGTASETSSKVSNNLYNNFQDQKSFSYSMAYPWIEDKNQKLAVGPQWKNAIDSSLPILSDMAPYLSKTAKDGEAATKPPATAPATQEANVVIMGRAADFIGDLDRINSMNHQYQGQTVAYADAHAEFVRRADVGQNSNNINDNIWTQTIDGKETPIDAGSLVTALRADSSPVDIVMVPTRSAKGDLK